MATPGKVRTPRHKSTTGLEPPRLDYAGLRHDFEQFGIEVTASSWQTPTPEFAEELYLSAARVLLDCQVEDLRPEESGYQNGIESLPDDGRCHLQGIGNLRFLRLCQRVCAMIGIEDFGIFDLTRPEGDRTYRFACAFINFVRYRERRLLKHHPALNEAESSCDCLTKLSDELDRGKEQYAGLKEYIPQVTCEIEQRRKYQSDLEQLMKTKHDGLRALEEQLAQQRNKGVELQARLDEQDEQLANSRQLAQDLEGQVVQSPNRLKQAMVELQDKLQHEVVKKQAAQNRCSKLKSYSEFLQRVEKRLKKKLRLCALIAAKIQETMEAGKAVLNCQAEESKHRELVESLKQDESQLRTTYESVSKRIEEAEVRFSGLLTTAEKDLAERKYQARSEEERVQRLKTEQHALEREVIALKQQVEALDKRIADTLQQFEDMSARLRTAFGQYKTGTRAAMEKVEFHEEYRRGVLPRKLIQSLPSQSCVADAIPEIRSS